MEEIYKKNVNENGICSCNEIDISVDEWKLVLQNKKNQQNSFLPVFIRSRAMNLHAN